MREIDDPKLRFYLERKRLIDEWAAIGKDEAVAADRFLQSLGPAIEELADEHSGSCFYQSFTGSERHLGLVPSTHADLVVYPPIFAGLGWSQSLVRFTGNSGSAGWVGMRIEKSAEWEPFAQAVCAYLAEMKPVVTPFDRRPPKQAQTWLVWTALPDPGAGYMDNLAPHADQLLSLVRLAWDELTAALEQPSITRLAPRLESGEKQ